MKALLPIRNKTLVAAALILLAGMVVSFWLGEIEAEDYRAVRKAFKEGTPAFRAVVAKAISDGKINRWEYRDLARAALDDNRPLIISVGHVNTAEERIILSAMARQVHQ